MKTAIGILAERVLPAKGGLAVATTRIAQHAQKNGYAVHLIYPSKEVEPGHRGRRDRGGLILHPIGAGKNEEESFQSWLQHTSEIVRTQKIKLLHGIYATSAGYVATLAACKHELPSIVSLRGNDMDRGLFRKEQLPFLRQSLELATEVTGVSQELTQWAQKIGRRSAIHISNSVDSSVFRPERKDNSLLASLGISQLSGPRPKLSIVGQETIDKPIILGFLGELRDKKGFRYLLPALDTLKERHNLALLIIGGIRAECQEAFEHFKTISPQAAERIFIAPYSRKPERLRHLLALCDLMLFPSLADGTPNAVLESMAAGKPILATRVGGIPDLIEHEKSGALFDLGHLEYFPEIIEEMLAQGPEALAKMGKAARQRVIEKHSPEGEQTAYGQLYQRLLAHEEA